MYVSNQSRHKDWFHFSEERLEMFRQALSQESKEYILNINETEYRSYLYNKYKLVPLQLNEEQIEIHPPRKEKRQLREEDRFERNPYYWVCSIAYKVDGTTELWSVVPSTFSLGGRPDFAVSGNRLTFVFNIQSQSAEDFNRSKDEALCYLRDHVRNINSNCSSFNASLPGHINVRFSKLKASYLQENSFFASINVTPNSDAPKTYSVPTVERRPAIQKPTATAKSFTIEPTVDDKAYGDIIDCLTRVGLSIERKPSLYVNKDEEALRDLFLLQLELAFDGGTATGETFNRSGKTDILLKNTDGTNLFVGECKVWKGQKHYIESLSQLLSYLSWDDSKTALMVFVKDVTLSSVIQTVKQVTLTHPSAVKLTDIRSDRFLHFIFTLPQDSQKHVAIQVLLFHFDKSVEGRLQ